MAPSVTGRQRYQWGLLLLVAAILVAWLFVDGSQGEPDPGGSSAGTSSGSSPSSSPADEPTATATGDPSPDVTVGGATDPESGLPWIAVADLPSEAADTLALIDAGGPFPEDRDGITFENREELLPDEPFGYYREYTVRTPGVDGRGARRIVTGDAGEYYWTEDHYGSFSRIAR